MKKNVLCLAVLAASFANAAMAQEYDDRWYLTGTAGYNLQDDERGTDAAGEFGIGVGRFFDEAWSLDFQLYGTNPSFERAPNLNFSQFGAALDLRRHFRGDNNWWPYLKGGIGVMRSQEEFNAFPNPNSPGERKDNNLTIDFGVGMQASYEMFDARLEGGIRTSLDDQSRIAPAQDYFSDPYVKASIVIPLGPKAEPAPPPAPAPAPAPVPSCETLDDDGDGVNNCIDKCPGSQAGQAIGPDGCAVALAIDLKGVNFNFDQATLRPDATTILNEAIEILKRNPALRVEVAGHTDLCGSDTYNQNLSQRRAQTVFDYLTSNGIEASRLVGPNGFGESRPLEQTAQTFPACQNERNRRTELNVQN